MRSPLLAGAVTLATALGCAAPAAADSIVYLRDWNVWLANPDGSGQYQVTTDGREGLPYLSPSQADDGTIAVAKYDKIILLRQNGSVIREIDPQPLRNTYSHQVDGSPKYVAISPDGSRIAFSYVSFEGTTAQATTGFVAADGTPLPGNLFNGFPSWVTNTRSVTSGGFGWHVNLHDQGQAVEARWMNDKEADLRDAEVNSQGTFIALVRDAHTQSGTETSVVTYQIIGDVKTGSPDPVPQGRCVIGPEPTLSDPSWSPNGQSLVWGEAGNLWTLDRADTCEGQARQLLAGGSDPDWGPAPVNPGPRETPPDERRTPDPTPRREQPRPTPRPRAVKPVVKAPKSPARFATAGLRVSYRCAGGCTVSATATADRATARALRLRRGARLGSATRRLKRAGTATVVVKPAAALRRRLARLRGARVMVRVVVRAAGTKARSYETKIVLRR